MHNSIIASFQYLTVWYVAARRGLFKRTTEVTMLHITSNMWALYNNIFGDKVEDCKGTMRFLVFHFYKPRL